MTSDSATSPRKELTKEALRVCAERDCRAAIEFLGRHLDPLVATQVFGDLQHEFYWQRRDLHGSIAFGQAGVEFGLAAAARVEQENTTLAHEIRSVAKGINYDIASLSWPGWDEPGIQITAADLAVGMDAAKTNLRLAKELNRGDLPLSRALWVLGAHHLAVRDQARAKELFSDAAKHPAKANAKADELLNLGYLHLTRLVEHPADANAGDALQRTKEELGALKDGKEFVQQLDVARRVFREKSLKSTNNTEGGQRCRKNNL